MQDTNVWIKGLSRLYLIQISQQINSFEDTKIIYIIKIFIIWLNATEFISLIRKIDAATTAQYSKMMFIPIILEIDCGTDQVQLLVQHLTNISCILLVYLKPVNYSIQCLVCKQFKYQA